MNETLVDLLNKEVLIELAGERAFNRGADYFAGRQVVGLRETDGTITARVRGTYYYNVKLWPDDGELAFECNCPVGQDGVLCKHCVAVGFDLARPEEAKNRFHPRANKTRCDRRRNSCTSDGPR